MMMKTVGAGDEKNGNDIVDAIHAAINGGKQIFFLLSVQRTQAAETEKQRSGIRVQSLDAGLER